MLTKGGVLRQNCVSPSPQASPPPGHGRGRSAPHKALYSSSFKEGEKQIPLETRFHGNQLAIDNVAAVGPPEGEKIFSGDQATERPKKGQLLPRPLEEVPQSPGCPSMGKSPGQFPKKGRRREDGPLGTRLGHYLATGRQLRSQKGHGGYTDTTLRIRATLSELSPLSKVSFLHGIRQYWGLCTAQLQTSSLKLVGVCPPSFQ